MNGQMMNFSRYWEYLKTMEPPMRSSELPKRKMNLSVIAKYAREHGICFSDMTEEEKEEILAKIDF